MRFTFYGDLLGIGAAYRLSPRAARDRLNEYYNRCFAQLSSLCGRPDGIKVEMFSDSIFVWGRDPATALEHLQRLYLELLDRHLMLRGAMVKGALTYEPRITLPEFQKHLPKDDTLARAVGLGTSQKGARLLIEPALAAALLRHRPEWLSVEGYAARPERASKKQEILRRICPTPDQSSYELLYFWALEPTMDDARWEHELGDVAAFYTEDARVHFSETLDVLRRSRLRREMSERTASRDDA